MISVTYTSNLREQVRAARAINRGQVSTWSLLALLVALPMASGVWGLATEGLTADVGQLFALAAAGCALWYLFPWFPVWVVRRGVRTPDGPVTVAFSEAGSTRPSPAGTLTPLSSTSPASADAFALRCPITTTGSA
jgi:hypothetical protein